MTQHVNELELDHHFWDAISTDRPFQQWFLARTKFCARELELVTDEKWHQRWYKCPVTKRDYEGDILLIFRDRQTGERLSVHIENKPDHRTWTPNQAEHYKKRAIDRMKKWHYVDFETVLIAPRSFIARWPEEAAHFDLKIPYDEIGQFIAPFATA
jgi:hypothetical protein